MSIETPEDLAGMEHAGRVTRAVLEAIKAAVRPGVSTQELDQIGARVMQENGARSAPKLVYGFPGHNCISVNDEIVHGVPGRRKLNDGDLVKVDVTVETGGYMGDACETVAVGSIRPESRRLMECVVAAGLCGHGIGRTIHEPPTIPNEFDPRCADVLREGMVFTIEPMIAAGTSQSTTLSDGWTIRTRDRSRSAHYEHTLLVTRSGARLLTA